MSSESQQGSQTGWPELRAKPERRGTLAPQRQQVPPEPKGPQGPPPGPQALPEQRQVQRVPDSPGAQPRARQEPLRAGSGCRIASGVAGSGNPPNSGPT